MPFGELYAVPSRNGVSVPKGDRSQGIKMINMGELFRFSRIGDTEMARVPLPDKDLEKSLVEPGDLLFARRSLQLSGAGRCSIVMSAREPRTFESSIIRVRLNPELAAPEFYYYFFSSRLGREAIETIVEQAVVAGIRASDLQQLPVPVPPLAVQRGIAATLGALDAKIESNRRVVALLSELLDTMAEQATVDLPLTTLGCVSEMKKDTVNPANVDGATVDHYSIPAFDENARPQRGLSTTIKSTKLLVPGRAILLSRLNPRFNRTWWVTPDPAYPALASTEFLCLMGDDEALAATWLALRTEVFRHELPTRVTGTSGSHQRVRAADVLSIEVPDVRKLAGHVKKATLRLLELAEQKRDETARLEGLRDALLPELLVGRIRVTEAEEAVAEVVA